MKFSKVQDCLSHIMQEVIAEDMHNATFGTNFPVGINGNLNLFQILHIAWNFINVLLSNQFKFTFELLAKMCSFGW